METAHHPHPLSKIIAGVMDIDGGNLISILLSGMHSLCALFCCLVVMMCITSVSCFQLWIDDIIWSYAVVPSSSPKPKHQLPIQWDNTLIVNYTTSVLHSVSG